jgi:O-glycosyl hydrolase
MRATFLLVPVAIGLAGWCAAAENAIFDRSARLTSILYSGDELPLRARIQIPSADWSQIAEPAQARRDSSRTSWEGSITPEPGKTARFRQTVSEEGGRIWLSVEVTADADLNAAGVYYTVDVPRAGFAGGQVSVQTTSGARTAALPVRKLPEREFFRAEGAAFTLAGIARKLNLSATLDGPHAVSMVERWDRTGRFYAAMVQMRSGPLAAGQTASLKIGLSVTGDPDQTPARLTVNTAAPRYRFQGFGGNYCFNIESPVSQYTLDNLKVAWGRTEMSLSYWEPENDNDSAAVINWEYFKPREQAYPRLRLEMQMGRKLQDKGIPYIASIWAIPEWIYTDPGPRPQRRSRRKIAPDKMDELVESISSYLLYAKQQYGAEPDMFSFNEANIGIDVLLTPEEHRDLIKLLGANFEKLGLKTRLLLGDATGPQNTHFFALTAAMDPEAMRYVKAIGFHSWGGGTPEQYKQWGDLAEWLGLPLLVTELGVDASAYSGGMYDSFYYGMREVRMYQELMLYARPQGTQQWEFTADYGIARNQTRPDGTSQVVPTSRFWLVKHFTDLTPRNSDVLTTTSDNDNVLLTAFAKDGAYTLHVANLGASRQVTIEGAPGVELRAIVTTESDDYKELPAMRAQSGVLRFEAPARSLLTLTTMPR